MKALPAPLSERTRHAVQDFTALNTITRAVELMMLSERRGEPTPALALHVIAALREGHDERVRVPLDCPLGRRMLAVRLLAYPAGGTRGVMRQRVHS